MLNEEYLNKIVNEDVTREDIKYIVNSIHEIMIHLQHLRINIKTQADLTIYKLARENCMDCIERLTSYKFDPIVK